MKRGRTILAGLYLLMMVLLPYLHLTTHAHADDAAPIDLRIICEKMAIGLVINLPEGFTNGDQCYADCIQTIQAFVSL